MAIWGSSNHLEFFKGRGLGTHVRLCPAGHVSEWDGPHSDGGERPCPGRTMRGACRERTAWHPAMQAAYGLGGAHGALDVFLTLTKEELRW